MRLLRLSLLSFVIMLALGITGCDSVRTWSAVFNSSYTKISDWRILTTSSDVAAPEWSIDDNGLYMHGKNFSSPISIQGDFTVTVIFDLFADELNTVDYVSFGISDGGKPIITCSRIQNDLFNLGDTALEGYIAIDANGPVVIRTLAMGTAMTLIRNGENEYRMEKAGYYITVYLNGALLWRAAYLRYGADNFVPMLAVEQNNQKRLLFKSITVEYDGNIAPIINSY